MILFIDRVNPGRARGIGSRVHIKVAAVATLSIIVHILVVPLLHPSLRKGSRVTALRALGIVG